MPVQNNIFLGVIGSTLFGLGIATGYLLFHEGEASMVAHKEGVRGEYRAERADLPPLPLGQSAAKNPPDARVPTIKQIFSSFNLGTQDWTGKVTDHASKLFQLTEAEILAVEKETRSVIQKIKALERANATIEVQNNSGARILVKGFNSNAEILKSQYLESMKAILGKQRGEIWIDASTLAWPSLFSNFGDFKSMNLLIYFNPDGTNSIEISYTPNGGGPTYGEKLKTQKIPDRLSHLLQFQNTSDN